MNSIVRIAVAGMLGLSLPAAALAQDAPSPPPADQSGKAAPAPSDQAPASQPPKDQPSVGTPPAPTPPASPAATPEQAAQTVPGSANLSVATVKMDGGVRASKIIGATVLGANNQELGSINDLILDKDGRVVLGVISVGSVLGIGGKLVAQPYAQFKPGDGGKLMLPNATKETLSKQPGFTYAD